MTNKNVVAAAAVLALLMAGQAHAAPPPPAAASVPERNLPPALERQGPANVVPPNALPQALDTKPLGPNLTALVVLGSKDEITKTTAKGVDTSRVPTLNDTNAQAQLQPYLGQPLTRRLIGEVEATIARIYREKGLPFVAVMTPPQEISQGQVQFRVVEFKVGKIKATGNTRGPSDFYTGRVRVTPGEPVRSNDLAEDLDWLNRSSFHQAEAVFSPGVNSGETDLNLRVSESKPWRVYAGYANSGAPSTSRDRYFAGAVIGDIIVPDSYFSYQVTGSRDFWYDQGEIFNDARHPQYVSNAARLALPVGPRQQIEFTFSAVESNRSISVFDLRQRTLEGSVAYRTAASNYFKTLTGDLYGGVEYAHQNSDTYFGPFTAFAAAADVYQVFGGWSGVFDSVAGHTELDAALHVSPGSVTNNNESSDFVNYSAGRVKNARYSYIDTNVTHSLPLAYGLTFVTTIEGRLASGPLPESQQLGVTAMRGYTSDDGSFDYGITSRNELHLPSTNLLGRFSGLQDQLSPYAFVDIGYVRDKAFKSSETPISAGVGANYNLNGTLSTTLDTSYALRDVGLTERGDWQLTARVSVAY
ncbi:MAG TPA: ShlB/FhaC/HecB family hemolysin secretion/activation protein [Parvibaculum sp.]|jgi:hemolysin activation/secretion protein